MEEGPSINIISCTVDAKSNHRSRSSSQVEQDALTTLIPNNNNNNNNNNKIGDVEIENEKTRAVVIPDWTTLEPQVVDALNYALGRSFQSINPPLLFIQISLETYLTFNLEKAVCNHGFFMMAPNKWHPPTKTLSRPLSLVVDGASSSSSVLVLILHSLGRHVLDVYILNTDNEFIASPSNLRALTGQIKRMLRISPVDEHSSTEFHKLYPEAAAAGFCRLFRSPTLFEDIIKSVLLINCGWGRSLDMAQALCELESGTNDDGVSSSESRSLKSFPGSKQLARLDVQYLKERCKLGFRADIISTISHKVEDGSFPLQYTTSHSMLLDRLVKIRGIGDFVAANVSMCMGFYSAIPIDSETKRHVQQKLGAEVEEVDKRSIMIVYHKFAPYQCLAYWFEHVMYYESKFGKLSEMDASSYGMVASSNFDGTKGDCKLQINESPPKKAVKRKKKKGRFSPIKYKRLLKAKC